MRRAATIVSLLSFGLVLGADAQRIAHEFVPDLRANEGALLVSMGGEDPDAIVYDGEILSAPNPEPLREGESAMHGRPGDSRLLEEPGARSPTFRPDRVTDLDGEVGYTTVFTPTIAPFKRVTAFDAIGVAADGTPVLQIGNGARTPVSIDSDPGAETELRDSFWGTVMLEFASNADLVPFPAVSPESRIISMRTTPLVDVSLSRDGADNLYAQLRSGGGQGRQVRVVFLMDAARAYFGRRLPVAPVDALSDRLTPMPSLVMRDALTFARELGLSRESSFRDAVEELVRHFRSFEESEVPPRNTGNIFLDLARGRRGICRHRAYGFVITAQALGVHARFVQNEAHAWVEVEVPRDLSGSGRGWLRIDLGGAATGLRTSGDRNAPAYRPEVVDLLPRPEEYERAYARAAAMSQPQLRERDGGANGTGEGEPGGGEPGGGEPGGGRLDGAEPGGGEPGGGRLDGAEPGATAPSPVTTTTPTPRGPRRNALELVVDRRRFVVFRGRELEVTGSVRGAGEGLAGLRVEVLLEARRASRQSLLGVTVTRGNGRFRGVFGVPPDLPVGDYRLLVRTPGDARWLPALAR